MFVNLGLNNLLLSFNIVKPAIDYIKQSLTCHFIDVNNVKWRVLGRSLNMAIVCNYRFGRYISFCLLYFLQNNCMYMFFNAEFQHLLT